MLRIALLLSLILIPGGFAANMILEAGDYRLVFSEKPELWSIVQVFYQGKELGTRTGYYSNVLAPQNGKYIGAGHTEGGQEKLLDCTLQVDGKTCAVGAHNYRGKQLVVRKTAMLDNIKMTAKYTLSDEGLKIDKQFEALAEQQVFSLYLYQFCWNTNSTDYLFGRKNGTVGTGKFLNDGQMRVSGEANAYYFAQYFPEFKLGVMNYMPEFGVVTGKNLLWDRPQYHKYYFWIELPTLLPANYQSPEVSMLVRAFAADSKENWEKETLNLAKTLQKQYPFVPNPELIRPLLEDTLTLPPKDQFQCHKIPLALDPNSNYAIAFEICKTPGINKKVTDHYLLVGYYDAKRTFKAIAGFADKVKADSQFHQIQGTFKAPLTQEDVCVYIYNSHSSGTVTVRNLEIRKETNKQ